MFKRILVPVGGWAPAAHALAVARTLAETLGSTLWLVTVIPRGADQATEKRALAQLLQWARTLEGVGIVTWTHVRRGDPSEEIIREAAGVNADMVVMVTHGRGGLTRAVLGSV